MLEKESCYKMDDQVMFSRLEWIILWRKPLDQASRSNGIPAKIEEFQVEHKELWPCMFDTKLQVTAIQSIIADVAHVEIGLYTLQSIVINSDTHPIQTLFLHAINNNPIAEPWKTKSEMLW